MRLPKRIAATGLAGLLACAIASVPAASAAQNYAPQCQTAASIANYDEYRVAYQVVCTDFASTETVSTAGDVNGGAWTAKDYAEGTFVTYSGKWYKAALDAIAGDEPTKPRRDTEGNDMNIWIEQTGDVAAAWSSSSTAASATAGSFPAGYVVSYTPGGGSKTYYRANADTVADDVPGASAKWDALSAETTAGKYTGPQPGGSKKVSVTYPGAVSGYTVVSLNREVLGFDTEPAVLTQAGDPAPQQTQFCNGEKPGFGVSCSLQSAVNVYAKKLSDNTFVKVTGATLAVKSSGVYTDLKDTTLYADRTITGSPSTASDSTDFFGLGALGLPTNNGKAVFPAQSGSRITGELELGDDPCGWGANALRLVVSVTDGEGQIAPPEELELTPSRYYRIAKNASGEFERFYMPAGCKFQYRWNDIQVYSRVGNRDAKLAKPARRAAPLTVEATV